MINMRAKAVFIVGNCRLFNIRFVRLLHAPIPFSNGDPGAFNRSPYIRRRSVKTRLERGLNKQSHIGSLAARKAVHALGS